MLMRDKPPDLALCHPADVDDASTRTGLL